jgi:transcription initiation factor TFIIIB Brf1 subunit/transcription initiation factor TFIIB
LGMDRTTYIRKKKNLSFSFTEILKMCSLLGVVISVSVENHVIYPLSGPENRETKK